MPLKLAVSMPPHVKLPASTASINWNKTAVLVPVALVSIYVFGLTSLAIILIGVISALLTEAGIQKFTQQELTIRDGDAALTGMILALLLPHTVPLWIPAIGSFFAIALVKHAFGGIGSTLFNPALAAWVFLNMSWWGLMEVPSVPHLSMYTDLILELGAGRLVEVSPVALLGGLYLLYKKYIDWRISSSYFLTTIILAVLIGEELSYVVTGVLFLGVFILATDPATSPITKDGRVIYGILCGVLTVIYGYFSFNYVVAVLFAIFFVNAVSPFIEKNTLPSPAGEVAA